VLAIVVAAVVIIGVVVVWRAASSDRTDDERVETATDECSRQADQHEKDPS